ncbi:MAG: hypothetical protein JWP36_1346 [Paucimonas sp.]|nr:hypothetical protein [Paucimonas sp.]
MQATRFPSFPRFAYTTVSGSALRVVTQLDADVIAAIQVSPQHGDSCGRLANMAAMHCPVMQAVTPCWVGAQIVVHTERGAWLLGSVDMGCYAGHAPDGQRYPPRLQSCIGGPPQAPTSAFTIETAASAYRELLPPELLRANGDTHAAPPILEALHDALSQPQGWSPVVGLQQRPWKAPDGIEVKKTFLTGVKHFRCNEAERRTLEDALFAVSALCRKAGAEAPIEWQFVPLPKLLHCASLWADRDLETTAHEAWQMYGADIALCTNLRLLDTLKAARAFDDPGAMQLDLSGPRECLVLPRQRDAFSW